MEGVVAERFFRTFDMSIRFGDIRDQSRKLSKIGPKIGRFLALLNFRGHVFQKLYPHYHPCLAAGREDTHTSPEVIEAHTLNFRPNSKFSPLIFPGGVCAR